MRRRICLFLIVLSGVLTVGGAGIAATYLFQQRQVKAEWESELAKQQVLEQQEAKQQQLLKQQELEQQKLEEHELTKQQEAEQQESEQQLTGNDLQQGNVEENVQVLEDVSLVFGGDVCFHDDYANMNSLRARGGKIDSSISTALLDTMKKADICMVNNEFTYSDRGTPLEEKLFTFRSKPSNVQLLGEMGVDIVSLANNHVYDYGEDALLDTMDTLKNAGIPYVGAGRNLDEAGSPHVFEVKGRKIAIISATQVERNDVPDTKGATEVKAGTFRCFTEAEFQRLTEAVTKAKEENDLVAVYIHWGSENTDELDWAQNWQAPKLAEAGADLIVGDHPHVLQGIDRINGTPVFYSMGNFWFNSKTMDTGLLKVDFLTDGSLKCQLIPAIQHDCRTDEATGTEKQRILQYLQSISPNVIIDSEGNI